MGVVVHFDWGSWETSAVAVVLPMFEMQVVPCGVVEVGVQHPHEMVVVLA